MFNVLRAALRVVPNQTVTYRKFKSRTPNAVGNLVNTYGEEIKASGSIQPAGANLLYKLGIANTEDLFVVYIRANVLSQAEIQSNDQIIDSHGNQYNVVRADIWFGYPNQDWNKLLVRRVKNYA